MAEAITTLYRSPVGLLKIEYSESFITSILFDEDEQSGKLPEDTTLISMNPVIVSCIQQLDEYFAGKRRSFDFPMQQQGTSFQQRVWLELQNILFGETISYLELSKRIGNIKAIRACGTANGQNQLAIVVPCHRVVGSNGKLVGYAGGLQRKKELLLHEAKYTIPTKTLF
ncbi:MAG: methylated-DNA--[protein]-cysteine S-methyltransferase [Bacteroidetes bacterium]|nr:methylated-DNA--[protein]-cysteine S-methyltransferase [Bacteroidota bacterium]